jgi:hypothetical protein
MPFSLPTFSALFPHDGVGELFQISKSLQNLCSQFVMPMFDGQLDDWLQAYVVAHHF